MPAKILVYVLRRDLRLTDNPIFSHISSAIQKGNQAFTHVLPLYVYSAQQIEVSGFLKPSSTSPYPEARSAVGGFRRCGHHRAKFLSECVWDLKKSLETVGSGLVIRVGLVGDVIRNLLEFYAGNGTKAEVTAVWLTAEEGAEEKQEERSIRQVTTEYKAEFKCWTDEKYFVDDRDLPFPEIAKCPDVFTSYRKMVEPLRQAPRQTLHGDVKLPPLPEQIPDQAEPFVMPNSYDEMLSKLLQVLQANDIQDAPTFPTGTKSAHPWKGGESTGHQRIHHLLQSGAMTTYKDTRNGMIGEDFSTKLSAWLALGCITARQIHEYLLKFEDGTSDVGKGSRGYGKGENKGTNWVRFELLWRDFMRLQTRKYGSKLFHIGGFKDHNSESWRYLRDPNVKEEVARFLNGTTGMSMIDASQRELYLTGYTSNRARQNVGSYLAKHLGIDWRIGAEWYESRLVDYDVSSNWGNWQSSFDYDSKGEYVKAWLPELRKLDQPDQLFQPWKIPEKEQRLQKLDQEIWVKAPLVRLDYRRQPAPEDGKSSRSNHKSGRRRH